MAISRQRSITSPDVAVRLCFEDRTYVRRPGDTLETDLGVLDIPLDVTPGDELETHLGYVFAVRAIRPPDCFEVFERSGAPMRPRDIGLVMGAAGVTVGDRVVDVGTGTGVLAAYLGFAGCRVLSFERDPAAADIARHNLTLVDLEDQVTVRTADAREAFAAAALGPADLVTLDTGNAPDLIEHVHEILRPGGFLAVYSPFVESARAVVEAARDSLIDVNTIETIQRELEIDERGTRPSTGPVGHSGYLTVARRQ